MRFIRALTILGLAAYGLALGGCASVNGYPEPYYKPDDLIAAYTAAGYFDIGNVLKTYNAAATPEAKAAWRDEVIEAHISAANIRYRQFEAALYGEATGSNLAADWLISGYSAAGVLWSDAAKAFNALTAVTNGVKSGFGKDALYDKTLPALLTAMDANRATDLLRIRQRQKDSQTGAAPYSIQSALDDLNSYANAGSLPGALTQITANSATQKVTAELQLSRLDAPDSAAMTGRKQAIAKYFVGIKGDKSKLDALIGDFYLEPGTPVEEYARLKIYSANAKTDADVDAIVKAIKNHDPNAKVQ